MNNQNAFQECVHYAELGEIEKISLGIFDNTEKIDVILTDLFECKNSNIEKPSSEKLLKIFSLCFAFSNIDLWPRDLREKKITNWAIAINTSDEIIKNCFSLAPDKIWEKFQ